MKKDCSLFFIRHGRLLLPYKDHSEMPFKVLTDLASLKLNPPIDKKFAIEQISQLAENIPLQDVKNIYASPSKRCQDTAQFIGEFIFKSYRKNIDVVTSLELSEIKFDLAKIYPHKDNENFGIESINDAVFRAMVNPGENCESASSAYKRIAGFLGSIMMKESSLFVTHDFIMRIIEIYIRNRREMGNVIAYGELKNTQRNMYLHGFATNFTFDNFSSF
ncbi:MAG: histidine phosphatase family protein [Candidatus Wildermuthbacteria bacterium]|nr:histidine phosphatase family protein [Candidatus Wildermuthbacteria bacterium]